MVFIYLAPVLLTIVGAIRKDVFLFFSAHHVGFFYLKQEIIIAAKLEDIRIKVQFQTSIKERFK